MKKYGRLKNIKLNDEISKRFWLRVDINEEDDCWYWLGGKGNGYGRFNVDGKKIFNASQVALALSGIDISEKDCVLHSRGCTYNAERYRGNGIFSRLCCNPNHLRIGTHEENAQDTVATGRARGLFDGSRYNYGETHPFAKLSKKDIESIKKENGLQKEIAKKYGIAQGHVSRIKNGVRRKLG